MSTVEVTNTLTDASGRPLQDVTVRIRLICPLNPYLLNGTGEIVSQVAVDTDTNGVWVAELTPNSELEQTGTYYAVDESCVPGGLVWPISVPEGGGPYQLRDLLVPIPPDSNPGGPVQIKGIWFEWQQQTPRNTWSIPHNLGFNPAGLKIFDLDGGLIEEDSLTYVDTNNLTLTFSAALSGTAWLS
ncbi:MAG TPA: hypothetical protein VGH72_33535 [Pseudonocardia sp.]